MLCVVNALPNELFIIQNVASKAGRQCRFSPHQLESNAEVAAKQEIVGHVDDVEPTVNVVLAQYVEYLDFNE